MIRRLFRALFRRRKLTAAELWALHHGGMMQ